MRPTWDEVWMSMAHTISRRSVDPAYAVGCVIISADNQQVLSLGYNGLEKGGSNFVDSHERGKSGCIHAEQNALVKLDYNNPKQKVMYVTLSPCLVCARMIVNADINVVVYDAEYRDTSGIQMMRDRGVSVRRYRYQSTI